MKEELFIKFLNGECTPEELRLIQQWIEAREEREELERLMALRWEQTAERSQVQNSHEQLLKNIHRQLGIPHHPKAARPKPQSSIALSRNMRYYLALAASIALVVVATWTSVYLTRAPEPVEQAAVAEEVGKSAKVGEKLTIRLPDGSTVILNSTSQIVYPSRFTDTVRTVSLVGEAYFEVVHDSQKPFKVLTRQTETTVLGTQFNVNARDEEQITLVKGSVKVGMRKLGQDSTVQLIPGQMAYALNERSAMKVKEIDAEEIISWKNGTLLFREKPLEEIMDKLETWYGVRITLADGVDKNLKVNGEFDNENLQNILDGLSFSMGLEATLNYKEVTIKSR